MIKKLKSLDTASCFVIAFIVGAMISTIMLHHCSRPNPSKRQNIIQDQLRDAEKENLDRTKLLNEYKKKQKEANKMPSSPEKTKKKLENINELLRKGNK